MGADLVSCEFKFPNFLQRYREHFKEILIQIAVDIQTNVGLRFDNEGAYNGHQKWKDLKSGLNTKVSKNGLQARSILKKSGALKNSIAPQSPTGDAGPDGYVKFEGDMNTPVVKVGTNVKYARIHNEGGVIQHPGTDNGFGRGIKIKAHAIKMPKRNFTDWNKADGENMEHMLKNLIQVLNG